MEESNTAAHFLQLIKSAQQGKLKIYIGMIAGVGKTCRMLRDAHDLLSHGVDLKIGYIETHGRNETDALLEGLPIIPRKKIFYKGKEVEEMDIDTILQLHPQIVIVDELAHSNIEGSRHKKRWEDVMEMLQVGINVITAVNIQHVESLHDEIKDIIGIDISERIPDHVLTRADEIVNIDLTANELVERLKEGKIYDPKKVPLALSNFFKKEHILHLRELALREVAFRVGKKIEQHPIYSANRTTIGRLLVCVSSNEQTQTRIIRRAARIAEQQNAELIALYVQTQKEDTNRIPLDHQRHLLKHLELAVQLGGRVRQVAAKNVILAIAQICKEEQITTLCIGHPNLRVPSIWLQMRHYRRLQDLLKSQHVELIVLGA